MAADAGAEVLWGLGAQELGVWYLHDNQVEMERLSLKVSFRWVLDNLA